MNLAHIAARLAQSGELPAEKQITIEDVKKMLCNRFETIDYAQAKQDVVPFIKNHLALDVWSADFFCKITEVLRENE